MGIGMTLFCSPSEANGLTQTLPEARVIGEVVKQTGEARVVID
jgi:phosphoribosylaminoimidazole (AIR) synthetase